jgi:hypothetical protein
VTYRPRKFAGMDLSARILKVLGDAGRPLTRGELLMHGGNFNNAKAAEIQAVLDMRGFTGNT